MARFMQRFLRIHGAHRKSEPHSHGRRWKNVMNQHSNGTFGLIVGGVVAAIAVVFILTGGELGGKKTVEGDQDLPPVASDTSR